MRKMIWRQVRLFLVLLLGYLIHVCVMPYVQLGDITPSFVVATIAVVTVGYGRLRALWAGAFYGILLETFLASVPMLNLMLYPIVALLCSVACADKTASRLQYERSIGKVGRNINPLLRTAICALLISVCIEIVHMVYTYLDGAAITASTIGRALMCIVANTLLTALVMLPLRKLLGFRKSAPETPEQLRYGKPLRLDS